MKKALTGVLLLLAACAVNAQEQNLDASATNVAVGFRGTSAARVKLLGIDADSGAPTTPADITSEASAAPAAALPAAPTPANPRFVFGERDDYRWQLGVGFEFFRFQSNRFDANLLGLNTSLAYYTNGWFALEGDVITGFSTETFNSQGDHAKIFGGLGGLRFGSRRAKWEPWIHALGGGAHLQPQTAGASRNGVMALAGGGVDYRVHARLSFRAEGDWVYTNYFSQMQNNFQGVAGVVLHF
jgi:hypothetical protein